MNGRRLTWPIMLAKEEEEDRDGDGDLAAFNRRCCTVLASERRRLTVLGFALRFDYPHSAAAAAAYARYPLPCAPTANGRPVRSFLALCLCNCTALQFRWVRNQKDAAHFPFHFRRALL